MNIPTRYCTGYPGDIGIPPAATATHFAAWSGAYLGDDWSTSDPRNNTPRAGRVQIVRGRDAADVALTTTFAKSTLESFMVVTNEVRA